MSRLRWVVGCSVLAAGLAVAYFHQASVLVVESDGASNILQASAMLHGNLLLHGWYVSDVSFFTTELPEYMLVVAIRGIRPDVVPVCAALTYTLLVLLAALVARGRARGREGIVRALIATGVMLAPAPGGVSAALLTAPDHTGSAVPVLLVLLLIDLAPPRWYVPVACCAVLAWAQAGDPLVLVIGAFPVAVVSLVRGFIMRERRWHELGLAVAAVASDPIASLGTRLIRAGGGYLVAPSQTAPVPLPYLRHDVRGTLVNVLGLFGTGPAGGGLLLSLLHLAGAALVAAAACLGIWRFFRPGDQVTQVLLVAIAANLGAYLLLYVASISTIREVAPVLSFGAALAGRQLGSGLSRLRLRPVLVAWLACCAIMLGWNASQRPVSPADANLAAWLARHDLRDGLGGYWQSNSVTADTGGVVRMRALRQYGGHPLSPYAWELNTGLLGPRTNDADFVVATPPASYGSDTVTAAMARGRFGPPAVTYRYAGFTIMVWRKNLLNALGPPLLFGGV